jgi:hypothetical protein
VSIVHLSASQRNGNSTRPQLTPGEIQLPTAKPVHRVSALFRHARYYDRENHLSPSHAPIAVAFNSRSRGFSNIDDLCDAKGHKENG